MANTVQLRLALQQERAVDLEARVRRLLAPLTGGERVLDAGCGTGALAYALAPHVHEVIGVDSAEDFLEAARAHAPANCTFLQADATALPFEYGDFDLSGSLRVLHHVRRPELAVSELARVTGAGGRILIADQLGSIDPIKSLELDRFEKARDPGHQQLVSDSDIRSLLDANDLVVLENEIVKERRDVELFLDLAGLDGPTRDRVRRMAPAPVYDIEVGWYVARKRTASV